MKTLNDGSLNDFTAWQWELAFIASRFRLGLLSDDEVIAFTHKLMDNGFYDDVMLDIIDDDPLYPSLDIKKNFEKMGKIFGLPCVHTEQAKLINSFQRFYPLSKLPPNLKFFLDLGSDEKLYLFLVVL